MSTPTRDSRFLTTPLVIDPTTEITRYIEWQPPQYGLVQQETLYIVKNNDLFRPDLISYRCYAASDLWWLIMHYNGINDPFSLDVGDRLRIPSVTLVNQVLANKLNQSAQVIQPPSPIPVLRIRPYTAPAYSRPLLPSETSGGQIGGGGIQGDEPNTLFIYGFKVPDGLSGNVHFQLVASVSQAFSSYVLNKFTLSDQTRWFFYNPNANSGSGGYQAFPSVGIDGELYDGQTVYYNIGTMDGLAAGVEYFVRYRTWVDNVEGPWQVSPPIIIPT